MNGVINILKPPGMTSSNVVFDVRRLSGQKKAGHCGTLDPGAAGVLTVCLGRAARLFDYLVDKRKTYRFEVLFGVSTDTLDTYGSVLDTRECDITEEQVKAALPGFIGPLIQFPPMYSAVKLDGKKLYQLARQAKTADLTGKERHVEIYGFSYVKQTGKNRFLLDTECSRGTYIRVLAEQLAEKLGTIACVSLLLRTRSGDFAAQDCVTIEEAQRLAAEGRLKDALLTPDKALRFPELNYDEQYFKQLRNGCKLPLSEAADGALFKVYCGGRFIGVGKAENGELGIATLLMDE